MFSWFLMLFVPSKHTISLVENLGLITLIKLFLGSLLDCWEFLKSYPLVFIQLNQLINFGLNYFLVGGEGLEYFLYSDLQMNRKSDIHPINQLKRTLSSGLIFCDHIIPKCKLVLNVPISPSHLWVTRGDHVSWLTMKIVILMMMTINILNR